MFTYIDPMSGDKDAVRFLVGDTRESEALLSDEEISWLVAQWKSKGSMYYVAAMAAESIAARFTREVSITSDGQTLGMDALQEKYLALAVTLRAQHKDLLAGGGDLYAGGMDASQKLDQTVAPLTFGTGMHDNRYAGRQDFGEAADAPDPLGLAWGEHVP